MTGGLLTLTTIYAIFFNVTEVDMEADVQAIAGLIGGVMSLVFKLAEMWVPSVEALAPKWKVLIALVLVSGGVFMFAVSDDMGMLETAITLGLALVANQTTHQLTRKL